MCIEIASFLLSTSATAEESTSEAPPPEERDTVEAREQPAEASSGDVEQAMVLYRAAALSYEEGRFEEAIALLRQSIERYDAAAFHHNLARALEQLGRWSEARDEYLIFLEREPDSQNRAVVESRLEVLDRRMEESGLNDPASEPQAPLSDGAGEGRPQHSGSDTVEAHRRVVRPWPWAIFGVGAAALVTGVVFGALFNVDHRLAHDPATNMVDAFEAYDRAESWATVANSTLIAGGVVALSGLIWGIVDLVLQRRDEHPPAAELSLNR